MTTPTNPTIGGWLDQLATSTGCTRSRLNVAWAATDPAAGDLNRYACVKTWAEGSYLDRDLTPDWRLGRAILRHRSGGVGDPGRYVRITQVHTLGVAVPASVAREGVAYRESFDGAGLTMESDRVPLCLEHNRAVELGVVQAIVVEGADTHVVAELHRTAIGDNLLADAVFGDRLVEASWSFLSHSEEGRWVEQRSAVIRQRAAISEVSIVHRGVRATTRVEHLSAVAVEQARSRSIPRGRTDAQASMVQTRRVAHPSPPAGTGQRLVRHSALDGTLTTGVVGHVIATSTDR